MGDLQMVHFSKACPIYSWVHNKELPSHSIAGGRWGSKHTWHCERNWLCTSKTNTLCQSQASIGIAHRNYSESKPTLIAEGWRKRVGLVSAWRRSQLRSMAQKSSSKPWERKVSYCAFCLWSGLLLPLGHHQHDSAHGSISSCMTHPLS